MIMEFRKTAMLTIPNEFVESLGIKEGDKLEITEKNGMIQIVPVVVYPKKYIESLSREVEAAKKLCESGEMPLFDNAQDMFKQLES